MSIAITIYEDEWELSEWFDNDYRQWFPYDLILYPIKTFVADDVAYYFIAESEVYHRVADNVAYNFIAENEDYHYVAENTTYYFIAEEI